jgi:uncharacterized membrane protein YkoI
LYRVAALAVFLSPTIAGAQTNQSAAPTPKISIEQASAAALKAVPGRVTSVVIERKRGKEVYVVEIQTRSGVEKDVFIDLDTGQVLGTEE